MRQLLKFEWKKTLKLTKVPVILLIFIGILSAYCALSYYQISSNRQVQHDNYKSLIDQCDENIKTLNDQKKNAKDDVKIRIDRVIESYKGDQIRYQTMLNALDNDDWKKELTASMQQDKATLDGILKGFVFGVSSEELNQSISLKQYLLDYNIKPIENIFCTAMRDLFPIMIPLLSLLVVSDTVAGEKKDGTLKLLTQQPYSRRKIIAAKFCNSLLISSLIFMISSVFLLTISALLENSWDFQYPVPAASGLLCTFSINGAIFTSTRNFALYYLLAMVAQTIIFTSVGLLISIFSPNGIIALTIAVFIAMLAPIIKGMQQTSSALQVIPFINDFELISGAVSGFNLWSVYLIPIIITFFFYLISVRIFGKSDLLS